MDTYSQKWQIYALADIHIEFVVDDSYFEEFFEQWVAVAGRGRIDRIMIPVAALFGVGCCIAASIMQVNSLYGVGAAAVAVSIFEGWRYYRWRRLWLKMCQSRPWYGKLVQLVLRDGVLVQLNIDAGAPVLRGRLPVRRTPRGYLIRMALAEPLKSQNAAVSSTSASVYLPHAAVKADISMDDLAMLLGAT